ncbi:hypothetical protein AA0614_2186 [Komagataeibacter saccharivorans NRIC 0614]|nr:hypothetical protein AA0614_2186 [Komagataeibacter saccharivorans NRIC 0614]
MHRECYAGGGQEFGSRGLFHDASRALDGSRAMPAISGTKDKLAPRGMQPHARQPRRSVRTTPGSASAISTTPISGSTITPHQR